LISLPLQAQTERAISPSKHWGWNFNTFRWWGNSLSQFDTWATFFLCTASCATGGIRSMSVRQPHNGQGKGLLLGLKADFFFVSFLGVTSLMSSIPSRLSTVRRLVHAAIRGSGFALAVFDFVAFRVRVNVPGFFVPRFLVFGRLFLAFASDSSSSESGDSTRRGITSLRATLSQRRSILGIWYGIGIRPAGQCPTTGENCWPPRTQNWQTVTRL